MLTEAKSQKEKRKANSPKLYLMMMPLRLLIGMLVAVLPSFVSSQNASFTCTVCPDGMAPQNPNGLIELPGIPPIPCREIDSMLAGIDRDLCQTVRFLDALTCGCDPLPEESACRLCPDPNTTPREADRVINPRTGLTCSGLAETLTFVDSTSQSCANLTDGTPLICGCPGVTSSCTLCEDGSAVPDSSIAALAGETCEIATVNATQMPEGRLCSAYQATAGVYCGCNNPIASNGFCRICGGSTLLPDPRRTALQFEDTGESATCGEIEFTSAGLECDLIQTTFGDACCGENATGPVIRQSPGGGSQTNGGGDVEGPCPLCVDGSPPRNPNRIIQLPGVAGLPCSVLVDLPDSTSEICTALQRNVGTLCGCPGTEDRCTLCPGGAAPTNPTTLLPAGDTGETLTCAELDFGAPVIPASSPTCFSTSSSEGAGAIQMICGCPAGGIDTGAPDPSTTCTICETQGETVTEPNLLFAGSTCESYQNNIAPGIPLSGCQNIRATAGVYCGCNNPVASQGFCRICGEGNLLPDANRAVGSGQGREFTCGELELNLAGFPCQDLQSLNAEACCGPATGPVPSPVPPPPPPPVPASTTPAPVEATPSPGATPAPMTPGAATAPGTSGGRDVGRAIFVAFIATTMIAALLGI